jgi:ABC-type microcin C transport system duplicated ATPase subunit YejF
VGEPLSLIEPNVGKAQRVSRVLRVLDEVGLGTIRLTARPHEFSGGQRQRIALARALVADPQLLVLDEAVSALDAATRNEILRLILALSASRGLGFLLVSHDLSVIRSVTDRICVLAGGVIVEEGATEAVLSHPEHPYTRQPGSGDAHSGPFGNFVIEKRPCTPRLIRRDYGSGASGYRAAMGGLSRSRIPQVD